MKTEQAWYRKHRSEIIQRSILWKKNNPERARELRRKDHRKARGVKNPTGESKTGLCDVCEKICSLHYDHSHASGNFRGWLCPECNRLLGNLEKIFKNDLFDKFLRYLNKHDTETTDQEIAG